NPACGRLSAGAAFFLFVVFRAGRIARPTRKIMNQKTGLSLIAVVFAISLLIHLPQPGNAQAAAADTITGKVMYSGTKPVIRTISMEANPACSKLHPNGV